MKKRKKLDGIVAGVLLYWIAFVAVAWVCYFVKDGIPDTLVQVGLGGGAVELVATAAIEILSNRRRQAETPENQEGTGEDGNWICGESAMRDCRHCGDAAGGMCDGKPPPDDTGIGKEEENGEET